MGLRVNVSIVLKCISARRAGIGMYVFYSSIFEPLYSDGIAKSD